MSENTKSKMSPFVKTVIALDDHFAELDRLSAQIDKMDMNSDFDLERSQQLVNRFTECGEAVSIEVANLSQHLNDSRIRAEAAAQIVSTRASEMQSRKAQLQEKLENFRILAEKVRALTATLNDLKKPSDDPISEDEKAIISMKLTEFEIQIHPLIEETNQLKAEAQNSKMKALERHADSLSQSLTAASQKLRNLNSGSSPPTLTEH